jgi:hypothetical protein
VTLNRLIERLGLSTQHFDSSWAQKARTGRGFHARPLSEILVAGSTFHRVHLKERLLRDGLLPPVCQLCGQDESWRGRRMSLILDHINGIRNDHRLANLRIVCPNCAATLDTHCGRQNKIKRAARSCAVCGDEFIRRYDAQRHCSRRCGTRSAKRRSGPAVWKVPHPPYDQLLTDVKQLGYLATGRRYGVSDNAIRKWIRAYERASAAPADAGAGSTRAMDAA